MVKWPAEPDGGAAALPSTTLPMAISVRHVHLTQETVERLFGAGYLLNVRSPLSQPGQYAAEETVTLLGPRADWHMSESSDRRGPRIKWSCHVRMKSS